MSKVEFVEKLKSLQKNEAAVEKDILTFLCKKDVTDSAFKSKLEELLGTYEKEQNNELTKFQNDLQKANNSINIFQNELVKPRPDLIQHIKHVMESIESQIVVIKTNQKSIYDRLIVSESALSAELTTIDNDLHKYEKPLNLPQRYTSVKSRTQTSNKHNLHPAIIEFDKFCSAHGPTNGWGEFEHQLFMKSYDVALPDRQMLEKMSPALPFKSESQILNQISWYRKFELLEKAKREALKEWRDTKNSKTTQKKQRIDKDLSLYKMNTKKSELYEKERQERLAHLNAYKVQKELQCVMAEEEALKARIAEEEKEAKRQQYVMRQKERALAFKEKKRVEQELREAEEHDELMQQREQSSVSRSELFKLHEKNMKIVERKQQHKQEKIIAEFEQQQRLEKMKSKVTVNVKRDPSRLLKKTQGQINREKDKSSTVNPVVGSRNMPHRSTPSWRQGL